MEPLSVVAWYLPKAVIGPQNPRLAVHETCLCALHRPSRLTEIAERRTLMQDNQLVSGRHHVRRDLAIVPKLEGREPWISAQRDPRRINSVRAKCVGDPL
jgi:hypothetical protein